MKLIDVNDAKAALLGWDTDPTDEEIEFTIDRIPIVDAVKVVHGEWLSINEYNHGERAVATCSNCHVRGEVRTKRTEYGFWVLNSPCCPNCGAKMDKKDG